MVKNLVVNRGFNSAARSSSLGCGWRDAEDQGCFQFSSVSQVYFHERLNGTTSNAQILSSNEADRLLF